MTTTTKFTPRPLKRVARCASTATLEFYIPREESGPSEERLALRRLLQYGCTRCLTPAQQQLTRLRYTDGLTVTAIAEQMGLAPSSVSRSLRVIRQRLYRFTEEAGEIGQLCDNWAKSCCIFGVCGVIQGRGDLYPWLVFAVPGSGPAGAAAAPRPGRAAPAHRPLAGLRGRTRGIGRRPCQGTPCKPAHHIFYGYRK